MTIPRSAYPRIKARFISSEQCAAASFHVGKRPMFLPEAHLVVQAVLVVRKLCRMICRANRAFPRSRWKDTHIFDAKFSNLSPRFSPPFAFEVPVFPGCQMEKTAF